MSQTDPANPSRPEDDLIPSIDTDDDDEKAHRPAEKVVLCPYCGTAQRKGDRCHSCGGLFEQLSQKATQLAMGPWYIRDKANPFRPGCSYDVIMKMVQSGRIKPTTVIRGPSTRQFWSIARNVEGVAHLLGYCHHCAARIEPTDASCEICGTVFKPVEARNELGLRYRDQAEVDRAQRELELEIAKATGTKPPPRKRPKRASLDAADKTSTKKSGGMLEDVFEDEAAENAVTTGASLSAFETEDARDPDANQFAESLDGESGGGYGGVSGGVSGGGVSVSPAVWVLATLNVVAMIGVLLLYLWVSRG